MGIDPGTLQQAKRNIFSNAYKSSPLGERVQLGGPDAGGLHAVGGTCMGIGLGMRNAKEGSALMPSRLSLARATAKLACSASGCCGLRPMTPAQARPETESQRANGLLFRASTRANPGSNRALGPVPRGKQRPRSVYSPGWLAATQAGGTDCPTCPLALRV